MEAKNKILIEGFDEKELLKASKSDEFLELIFSNAPVIFKAGSSEILGQFKKTETELEIVFSHIIGGGEGVLIKLMNIFRKFAQQNNHEQIIWIVHAVNCPKPNPKLPGVLEKRGFKIYLDPKDGQVYRKVEEV